MSLSSLKFLAFTLLVLIIYYAVPKRRRWIVLLCASMGYYLIVCYKYIAFILITIVSTFFGGKWLYGIIESSKAELREHKAEWSSEEKKAFKAKTTKRKKGAVALILLFNFGILAFLKYYNFFADSISALFTMIGLKLQIPELGLILPLGISFYTFQSMGYVIDIYRGRFPAEKNIAKFGLFVSFFPQIVQGPISLYGELAPQLYNGNEFDFTNIKNGAELVLYGFFKKLIIADRLTVVIKTVLGDQGAFSGTMVLLSALAYAVQLYADFSGGIDITRGVAEMFGIILPENFRRPYFSRSISEYWRRWHITLGAWLKNYLFYPIAMSKAFQNFGKKTKEKLGRHMGKVLPTSIASLITFIVIGIWHGANWKYVAFGFWNGIIIMISTLLESSFETWMDKLKIKRKNPFFIFFQMVRTFIIVLVGYYFDIADGFKNALVLMYRSISDFHISDLINVKAIISMGLTKYDYLALLFAVAVVFIISVMQERSGKNLREALNRKPFIIQCIVLLAGIGSVVLMGVYGPGLDASEFVYMQF